MPISRIHELTREGVDLFEMRIDLMEMPLETTVEFLEKVHAARIPSIGTLRETETNRQKRLDICREILPFVDALDVELGSPLAEKIHAMTQGKIIIVSEHDFEKTPDIPALKDMVDRSIRQGAHIVKIAAMANDRSDITRLLRFTEDTDVPMVSISMGPLGTISRVLAPLFGSLYSYAFVHGSVAPGQLPVKDLAAYFKQLYPEI